MNTDWEEASGLLKYQMERRRIDSNKKDYIHGPYLSIKFEFQWLDMALNYITAYTGGELVSIMPHGEFAYKAVFKVPPCHKWP